MGAKQGDHHASSDLTDDIEELMGSLAHHHVYEVQPGRVLNDDDKPVPDAIGDGFVSLTYGSASPLSAFNRSFKMIQNRFRMRPLVGDELLAADGSGTFTRTSFNMPVTCTDSKSSSHQPKLCSLRMSVIRLHLARQLVSITSHPILSSTARPVEPFPFPFPYQQ